MRDLFKVHGRKKAAVVALVYLGLELVLIAARNDSWWTVFVLLTSPWGIAFSIFFSVAPSSLAAHNFFATAFYWTSIVLYMTLNPLLIYIVGGWIEQPRGHRLHAPNALLRLSRQTVLRRAGGSGKSP